MGTFLNRVRSEIIELNLFRSGLNEVTIIQQERWSTRVYLLLVTIALGILLIYTALGIQTVHVVINSPSLETLETLQLKYVETLKCPCTQIAVKYRSFLQIQPVYHPICSSSFVTQEWISAVFATNVSYVWPMDVRTVISAHAQLLRTLCANTQQGISFVELGIYSSSLVSVEVLPFPLVQTQVNIQGKTVRSAGKWQLTVLISFLQLFMSSSHLMTGFSTNAFAYIPSNDSATASVGINSYRLNNNSDFCYCLSMSNCSVPGALYPTQQFPTFGQYDIKALGIGSIPVKGIEVGCFALDGALASTLECYYDSNCIKLLVYNSERFPPLKATLLDNSSQNKTIQALLDELLVEDWLINMSYANYYSECAPKTCSYSFNQRNDFLIILTIIVALIGGLNTVLRLFAPMISQIIIYIKQKIQPQDEHVQRVIVVWTEQHSLTDKIQINLSWLWLKITMANMFDSNSNNPVTQKSERQTTRLYIVFITIAFLILLFYTIATKETKIYTIEKPLQEIYEKLYAEHPNTIRCTCSEISMPNSVFITIETSYHQICSSPFISPVFFTQLAMIRQDAPLYPVDFMLMSAGHFQWMTTLCALSQLVFSNQLNAFQANLFVNDKLLTRDAFEVRTSQLADFFIGDVQLYFSRGIKETLGIVAIAQPISATSGVTYRLPITTTSSGIQVRIEAANYFSDCSCVSDPTSCTDEAAFYSVHLMNNSFYPVFKVPGVRIACSPMQSLLESNLACWYSSECYNTVAQYWRNRTSHPLNLPPILNSTIPSRFNPSTLVSALVDKLMVEDWSKELSYNSYYKKCAPLYCTYLVSQRKDAFFIGTVLLGLLGGLNIALKIVTPLLIKLIIWLIRHGQDCSMNFLRHLSEFPSQLVHLNLFYHRHQSSELTINKERQSTRLYLLLLITSTIILIFYYSLSYSFITITIDNPTPEIYEKLRESSDTYSLQCPCTHVSIAYGKFVEANTTLHEICSSAFIEDAWIKSIFGNGSWSYSDLTDLHGRGVVYFQGFRSLCFVFQENITQYVTHFLASSFISAQVLSETQLISQVNDTIEQVKISSRADHTAAYGFGRALSNDIQMMTIYSTNWAYATVNYDPNLIGLPIPLEPVYHGNCSCALSSKCLEPITLNGQVVPGLVLGCLPLESFFQSTLVCLYNQTCIDQININNLTVIPLIRSTNSELSINRTVEKLVENAFDLQWSVDISYKRFLNECLPASCSYSMNQRRDAIQIIVTLLGFYGGLTVALRYIVPYVIAFLHLIDFKIGQRTNDVRPQIEEKFEE